MAELQTNLNVAPFYDDYDENKQYYRILFRPATAVQARELTQLQTIMQKQVSRFGNQIYNDGSIVEGVTYTRIPRIDQIKFTDDTAGTTFPFNSIVVGSEAQVSNSTVTYSFSNTYLLVSNTTGVRAALFQAFNGAESAVNLGSSDTNRAYVLYIMSGNTGGTQVNKFSTSSEQIDVYSYAQDKFGPLGSGNYLGSFNTLSSNSTVNALGVGYGIHFSPGIIYQKGYFLNTSEANFIIKEHSSNAAGMKVGFDTKEYIVGPSEDPTLYDNSLGSSNYSAPGAYRLKLVPEPVAYDSTNNQITIPENFLPVINFDGGDGRPVTEQTDPDLSALGDLLAKRTFEESGNYVVKPFTVDVSTHASNSAMFYYNISPGIAYVEGQRVEFRNPLKISVPRANYTESELSDSVTVDYGNYVKVKDMAGTFDISNMQEITFYSKPQEYLSLNPGMSGVLADTYKVGNANIKAVRYETGTVGTANAVYKVFFFNYRPEPSAPAGTTFSANAKSIVMLNTSYGNVYADLVTNSTGFAETWETKDVRLIYDTGKTGVKRLTSNTGVNNTRFIYRTTNSTSLVRSGGKAIATFNISAEPDVFNFNDGTITDTELEEKKVLVTFGKSVTTNQIITNGGVSGTSSATYSNVTSVSSYTGGLRVGDNLKISGTGGSNYVTITDIYTANLIRVQPALTVSSTLTLYKYFPQGTPIDFTGAGNTFAISSSGKVATINLAIDPDTATTYTVNAQIPKVRTGAVPIKKTVNKNIYVKINCATNAGGITGPWCLGFPDVYKIVGVYVGAGYSVSNPNQIDWFDLETGQTDNMYGLSYLKLKPQYAGSLTSSSRVVVELHHLSPDITSTQAGFFSVDSYNIDDANTSNTTAITTATIPLYTGIDSIPRDLRNSIDIRPMVTSTATSTTSLASATINPANNLTTFATAVGADMTIEPYSDISYNVEYYLPRVDAIVLNKDKSAVVKNGIPSLTPKPPYLEGNGLKIAEVLVPPYPSLTFSEAE